MRNLITAISLLGIFLYPSFAQPAAKNGNAATGPASDTEKPDIDALMKADSFTNANGVLMVKISPSLWAGKFEVTQQEYQKVTGGNPSSFGGARKPVDTVSWNDAISFCAKLTEAERKQEMLPKGFAYTLPTQAQWESLVADADLKDAVTSANATRSSTANVGSLGPNSLGLYDTRGNLWEWCLDPEDQPYRVLRGAAWNSFIDVNLRIVFRWYSNGPDDRKNNYGFRCVLSPGGK